MDMSYLRQLTGGRQRGQMLVIVAIMGLVLIGAAALAVDLSTQRNSHRYEQNWGDTASLSGVRDCASSCNALTEVQDAFEVVRENSPWSSATTPPGGASPWPLASAYSAAGCAAASCAVTYASPAAFGTYSVSISSPPAAPKCTTCGYTTTHFVEVDVNQTLNTNLGAAIGIPVTTAVSHTIAYSAGPPGPLPYAFFSKTHAESGNQQESIVGDTFVGAGYKPQSSGQAGLCVYEVPNDPGDGGAMDNDLNDQGHVVFGGPGDPTTYPNLSPPGPPQPQYANSMSACVGGGAGGQMLIQTGGPNSLTPPTINCPVGTTTVQNSAGVWICFQANPSVPDVKPPTTTALVTCIGGLAISSITGATSPGVYEVPANCSITIDFTSTLDINCVSLRLNAGSTIKVRNKQAGQFMTSYGYAYPDTLAASAIGNLAGAHTAPSASCGGHLLPEDKSVIWAPNTSVTPMPTVLTGITNGGGCCSDTLFIGTIFAPNQAVNFPKNEAVEDVGSVYVGDWFVQSGFHPNPVVTYDANGGATAFTAIRIVE
jgi:hypothetical protein